MSDASTRTFEDVKNIILSAHEDTGAGDKVGFYNRWAENYEKDVAVLDYRAPTLAAQCLSRHFHGDREAAMVLDVCCGTGLVAGQMKKLGFQHFVGIDGSKGMLELANQTDLYVELKKCTLKKGPLPVQSGAFDVVMIVGALSVGHVPVCAIREMCQVTKPGGYICMTTRGNHDNAEYKTSLERELEAMVDEGLCCRVAVEPVEQWERAVREREEGYIPGLVYLYQRTSSL